jgi:hypothetical protein
MKENRPNQETRTAKRDTFHSTKSVPAIAEILHHLLAGEAIHHHDIIKTHSGQQHRLGITISRLRHQYGFGDLIQCPRGNLPLKNHYFIATSDLKQARDIAEKHGLIEGGEQ